MATYWNPKLLVPCYCHSFRFMNLIFFFSWTNCRGFVCWMFLKNFLLIGCYYAENTCKYMSSKDVPMCIKLGLYRCRWLLLSCWIIVEVEVNEPTVLEFLLFLKSTILLSRNPNWTWSVVVIKFAIVVHLDAWSTIEIKSFSFHVLETMLLLSSTNRLI